MNKIYYFTGSGNSLAIAKRVAEKLDNCELIRVISKMDYSLAVEAEILGFVFPVYCWGIPVLYREFVEKINISQADYVFAIINYAVNAGNTLGLFNKILDKKKIKIDAFGEVLMPSNYVIMGNASSVSEADDIIQKSELELKSITDDITERKMILHREVKGASKLLTALVYPLFSHNVKKSDKAFFSTGSCSGCGICVQVCPAENIFLNKEKRPEWLHRCEQCHACLQWCPDRAIEFNKKTSTKNRYTHPEIKLQEIMRKRT